MLLIANIPWAHVGVFFNYLGFDECIIVQSSAIDDTCSIISKISQNAMNPLGRKIVSKSSDAYAMMHSIRHFGD